MSIITWNCQGALDRRFPSILNTYVDTYKPDIFVLLEPRISGVKADRVIKKLRFPSSHRIEAHGFSGGIWVLWSHRVTVDILINHFQFVHMSVHLTDQGTSFLFTAIYGSPQPSTRRHLWTALSSLHSTSNRPWLLSGDFNATINHVERKGGAQRRSHGCSHFKSFIHDHDLLDLGSTGPTFTWRRGTCFARLDRALSNPLWLHLFQSAQVTHLPNLPNPL